MKTTAGERFREALVAERPLQIAGAVNAYAALLAERQGFRAIYLSGSGVSASSYGLPDLGVTTLDDVLIDVRRITAATETPLLVDIDTGWDDTTGVPRTIREMGAAGAAAVHIEDQVSLKRCGHRPNKALVSTTQMCDRIKASLDARTDDDLFVIARTDALAVEGFDAMLDRINAYCEAGADGLFAEAMTTLDQYEKVVQACPAPVLANLTEFGKTPLYTLEELKSVGIGMALYPLSAFRAMSRAAEGVYATIRREGSQADSLDAMQSREELYDVLRYYEYEQQSDQQLRDASDGAEH